MYREIFILAISFLSFIALIPILSKIGLWLTKQWFKLWRDTNHDSTTEEETSQPQTKDKSDRV